MNSVFLKGISSSPGTPRINACGACATPTPGPYDSLPETFSVPSENLPRLLKQFCHLPGSAQQIELRLLPGKVGIEKGQPLVVLIELSGFQVPHAGPPLLELCLQNLEILLCQIEFQPTHLAGGVRFLHQARLM